VAARWAQLGLTRQFTVATSAIVIIGMLIVGHWVTGRISDAVVHSNAVTAALYTDRFIEPRVQELVSQSTLSPANERALEELLLPRAVGQSVVGFRIWKGDTIVYGDRRELIGRTFPPSPMRQRAWEGQVGAEYGHLDDPDHAPVGASSLPIVEIYAPVYETGTTRIVALAETYQLIPTLPEQLAKARIGSWMVVGLVALGMLALQFVIVRTGSRTIQEQRAALNDRIAELSRLLEENETLRGRANQASRRVTEMNERYLRQIGSDLHDGPLQVLCTVVLRLGTLKEIVAGADQKSADEAIEDISVISEALRDSVDEIRNLSAGLALPEIDQLSLAGTLDMVARRHERRTGTAVRREVGHLPDQVPLALKSCLYRFAEEGLNNAFRHAGGKGQTLSARHADGCIEVDVIDDGSGLAASGSAPGGGGQGLIGLRDRIDSLGGKFRIQQRAEGGTRVSARFPLSRAPAEGVAAHV
jgi:signal transduction histidine kinase